MYSKKTRVHCYAFTLLPALIGLVLWSTNPQTVFPLAVLFTPVLLALTLALCLHLTEKLEKDREKNKKVNSIVIWIIPVLSNITFWISYAIMVRHMDLPIMRIMAWLLAAMYLVLGNYMPKCRPNNTVGIRVKWTFSSEENWNATHRLAGPSYMICGFLMIPVSFLPEKTAMPLLLILLLLGSIIPLVYSYIFYKKQQRQGVTFRPRPRWERKVNQSAITIGAVILVFVAVMLFTGSVKYQFLDTAMQVDVTYYGSTSIPYSEISDAQLRSENVPGSRTWGLGSFRLLAGLFENEELGSFTRMTYYNPRSAIVLKMESGKTYVLSGRDPAETAALYQQILEHIG
ncbi:SdpI family protein [Pseudoflavonifractor sp. MSJ-30]|uniref:SdpI family protein n=1 Tax=Pseudoflavonifractor sp. MSJ-30 TaxID=2841525 RepID=UPI001C11D112|nr:SdpI family protein [Pseudoflavonifractor sp. MSJ-30]MBU5453135.1 SdpI family protein [Pseudoflavonifractor sp. MSJ-30]